MARAALSLFEATGESDRLAQARRLAAAANTWFADADSSYFTTASDAADIPFGPAGRPRVAADNATPGANGLMAEVLARLHHLTGEAAFRSRAEAVLTAFGGLGDSLAAAPTLLAAADLLEEGAVVVISGPPSDPLTEALVAVALASPDPATCVLRAAVPGNLPAFHPAYGKTADMPAAYLCRAGLCGLPVTSPDTLAAMLRLRGRAGNGNST
jgi:uncharacterized protein YyaL (SSP411 family)